MMAMTVMDLKRVILARDVEIVRLRAAADYCRMRLKQDSYRETLDAILRGDKDESIKNPDLTPMVR